MTNAQITTGHEIEIEELEKQAASPERRALTIKMSGEALAGYGETLRLAALGLLEPIEANIFGESKSVAQQVADAEAMISRHMGVLANAIAR